MQPPAEDVRDQSLRSQAEREPSVDAPIQPAIEETGRTDLPRPTPYINHCIRQGDGADGNLIEECSNLQDEDDSTCSRGVIDFLHEVGAVHLATLASVAASLPNGTCRVRELVGERLWKHAVKVLRARGGVR